VRGVVAPRRPDQEDDAALPDAQALKPELSKDFAIVFHSDHRGIEDGFQVSKIDPVLPDVSLALRFVPGDHSQIVDANCLCSIVGAESACSRD
jgi:hypothetical protein